MSDDEVLDQSSDHQYRLFGQHMENYNAESSALHRKLHSKVEALSIMRKELERFRTERDQFKLMAETLQLRYSSIARSSNSCSVNNKSSVANILHDTRERNIKLTTEVEALKQKLCEVQGDIELLRESRTQSDQVNNTFKACYTRKEDDVSFQWQQERASFICHLEHLKKKNAQLVFDLKALIDEKEELIMERDAYKCKSHRLNHELLGALKGNEAHSKFLDIDSILLENKYLHERLKSSEEELDLTKKSINKYKLMLESKRKRGVIKLGSSSHDENVLSHKQVKSLLESGVQLPSKAETIQDLKSLCLTILDNLNDKNLALNHQKRTNRILGEKIAELEGRIQSLVGAELPLSHSGYSPSQFLLQNYCPSLVDCNDMSSNAQTELEGCNNVDDSLLIDPVECKQTTSNVSDDDMSSFSTESARSVISSEYNVIVAKNSNIKDECNVSDLQSSVISYCSPTISASNSDGLQLHVANSSLVSSNIEQERFNYLKDLPPDLAALVQRALHELDLRDFETNSVLDTTRENKREAVRSKNTKNDHHSNGDHAN